jgi:hypothetical protein
MADADHGLAVARGDMIDQLRDEVRPAVGDGVARVVPDPRYPADLEVVLEAGEELPVARRGKAVRVREVQDRPGCQAVCSFAVIV